LLIVAVKLGFVVGSTTAGGVAPRQRRNDFFWFIRQMVK